MSLADLEVNSLSSDISLFEILKSGGAHYSDAAIFESFVNRADEELDPSVDVALEGEGVVTSYKDSVVTITGLGGVQANELIYFSGGASGVALNLEYNVVKALVFGGVDEVKTGETVKRSQAVMRVGIGQSLLGRVLNPLGMPVDGLGSLDFEDYKPIEQKAPGVITRKKISQPLETGLKIVDALVPIGRGQRELVLGDRKTGKTTIVIDTILNQRESNSKLREPVVCVYVAIGKRMSEMVRLRKLLLKNEAIKYTILVVARSSDPASMQFIAPYSACTMAEYFTYKGQNALIVFDDLSRHADAYRELSLLLRRPVGREAYPGDIFYLHSRLLERAVKLNIQHKFGSLTALPIVETIQGDVSAYIPTNVISITDGQIYLNLGRHQEGLRPAVDPGLSVSRVGSSAQEKMMKRLAGSLKLELAQYREVEQFSKFGSELDAATIKQLRRGQRLTMILLQERNKPISTFEQAALLHWVNSQWFHVIMELLENQSEDYFKDYALFLRYHTAFLPIKPTLEGSKEQEFELFILMLIHFKVCYKFNAYVKKIYGPNATVVKGSGYIRIVGGARPTFDSVLKEAKALHIAAPKFE